MGINFGSKEVKEIYYGSQGFATQGPCPSGFHVPTTTEWQNVYDMGVALGQWSSSNGAGIKTKLKLPLSGFRANNNGSVSSQGTSAYYWCADGKASNNFYAFYFTDSRISPKQFNNQPNGSSVRPFKNIPQVPNSSWITIYQGGGNSGIFHNPSEGLISISSDGITWITLSDKNVGATTVYNTGDTLSEANCGKYFQRGNNYGFPWTGSTTNINTQVNASSYGPGNYYSSDKFFVATYYTVRDSSGNFDLRGGVTGNVNINMAVPIKEVYYGSKKIRPGVGPGIYYNATLGLISLSGDGSTWITIADKNLGATNVGDYGNYYQWGNNYGFIYNSDPFASSSTVNASSYGPTNYYSNYIFRTVARRDSSGNVNLWGDTTNNNIARKGPCSEGFHIMSVDDVNTILSITQGLTSDSFLECLKIPKGGLRGWNSATAYSGVGTRACLRTSTTYGSSSSISGRCLDVSSSKSLNAFVTSYALPIRPFKNEAIEPDSTRTKLY